MNLDEPLTVRLEMDEMWEEFTLKKRLAGFGMRLIMKTATLLHMFEGRENTTCYNNYLT